MKLNLSIGGSAKRGYLNIDPKPKGKHTDDNLVVGDVLELDSHVDNAECDEILVDNVLDYVPHYQVQSAIKHWVSKLRKGGEIIITGTDLVSVTRALYSFSINTSLAQSILYGEPHKEAKKSCSTVHQVVPILKELGIKIIKQHIADLGFTVIGRRV